LAVIVARAVYRAQLQSIERTAGCVQTLQGHAQIARGGANVSMAQQNLNRSEIRTGIQHVGGAGVTEQMRMHEQLHSGSTAGIAT
jgi:hypothetical protein